LERAQEWQGPGVPCGAHAHQDLAQGISIFKEQSQARALGQPVSFQRLKAARELSAPPGTGFSIITRELDASWWIQVRRQPHARASSARDEARLSIPSVIDRNHG